MFKIIIDFFIATILFKIFFVLKVIGKKNSSDLCAWIFSKVGNYTRYENIAKKNISYIWPEKKNNDVEKITKKMWKNLGRNFGELVHLNNYNPLICKQTKVIDLDEVKNLISLNNKKKKGIVFFSAHYGNWELGPIIIKKLGLDPLCVYRKSNNKFIEYLIQRIREKNGTYTPKGDIGAKKSFLWLRKGKSLALLMDQKLNEGPSIDLLGKPAYTASFIAEIAIRMDLDIVPIKFSRDRNNKNIITFYRKINMPKNNLNKKDRKSVV